MQKKSKVPLMRSNHLPLILLGAVMTVYGLAAALAATVLSNQAMRGMIAGGVYKARQTAFDQTASLVAGILLLALFIWCAVASKGIVRVGFCFGAMAALMTMLVGRNEMLPVPSAFSGPVIAILVALPLTILFILWACGRRVPRGCRWVAFISIFIVLAAAIFPTYVILMVSKIPPGDPAILTVGKLVDVSTNVIKLRYLLPGLSFLLIAYLSMWFARKNPAMPEG